MKKLILLAVVAVSALTANAYDFIIDGICYNKNSDSISVTVTHKGGVNRQYPDCTGTTYDSINENVTIPSTVSYNGKEYSVTRIGEQAFVRCGSMKSIIIPNSVTSIDYYAFFMCSGLTTVTIGNSVTTFQEGAFSRCSSLTSVTIPNSVTTIGNCAFYCCSGLTSVTIPNSVTSLGDFAFKGCSGLTSVTIGNSVTSIGEYAFCECTSLTSVTIPNSVTTIGRSAFSKCNGLTSVTIGNSVTSIGYGAFWSCTGLTAVNIPNSVTSIGGHAFWSCTGLTSVTISNPTIKIGEEAFTNNPKLKTVKLPVEASIRKKQGKGCFEDGVGRMPTAKELASMGGKANFNILSGVMIKRGMKLKHIEYYSDLLDEYYIAAPRISKFRRTFTRDNTSYYDIEFDPYVLTFSIKVTNGVVTSVSY